MINKKRLRVLAALVICIFLIQTKIGIAAGTPVFSLLAETGCVKVDSQYSVKLHVANAQGIYGFEAIISYEHGMTEFVEDGTEATNKEGLSFYVKPKEGTEDPIVVVYTGMKKTAQLISGDVNLFNINLIAKKAGTAELILVSVKVSDNVGNIQTYAIGRKISVVYGDAAGPAPTPTPVLTPDTPVPLSTPTPLPMNTAIPTPTPVQIINILPELMPLDAATGIARVDIGEKAKGIFSKKGISVVNASIVPGTEAYTVMLPADSLSGTLGDGLLNFSTEKGGITIPGNMLKGISEAIGKGIGVTIGRGDKSELPDELKEAIGGRPLVQLVLTLDGVQAEWNNPYAPVTVSIPYTPTVKELADPEHIVVWYIDGEGNVVPVSNGRYNTATRVMTFTVTHFSYYAIAYVHKAFADLRNIEWARKAIEVLASKGIIHGTGGNAYSPTLNVSRAEYLLLLVKTLGLRAKAEDNFDDVKPGTYYYEAVGIAKKLGITTGVGNNLFKPGESMSRQDMMVLTAKALEKYEGLKIKSDSAILDKFADRKDIAGYAAESIETLVSEGLISGSGNKINPHGQTTRAEAAVFLYRIYNRYI